MKHMLHTHLRAIFLPWKNVAMTQVKSSNFEVQSNCEAGTALRRGLSPVISKSPFQPKLFCASISVTVLAHIALGYDHIILERTLLQEFLGPE